MDAQNDSDDLDLHTLAEQIGVPKRTLQNWMKLGAIEYRHDDVGYRTLFSPRGVLQARAMSMLRAQKVGFDAALATVATADVPTLRTLLGEVVEEAAPAPPVPTGPILPEPTPTPTPTVPIPPEPTPTAVADAPSQEVAAAPGVVWRCYEIFPGLELSVRGDARAEVQDVAAAIIARYAAASVR